MKQTIQADSDGFLERFANFLKSLSDIIYRGIDKLIDIGYSVDSPKSVGNDGFIFTVTTKQGNKFEARCRYVSSGQGADSQSLQDDQEEPSGQAAAATSPTGTTVTGATDNRILNIRFIALTGAKAGAIWDQMNVKPADLTRVILAAAKEFFPEEQSPEVSMSTPTNTSDQEDSDNSGQSAASSTQLNKHSLKVTLKAIESADQISVHLCAINANYCAADALKDLNSVLDSTEFLATLSSEPVSFEIVDEGDSFEVNPISTDVQVPVGDYLYSLMQDAYLLIFDLQTILWNYRGDHFSEIQSIGDSMLWAVQYDIRNFGELHSELFGNTLSPKALLADAISRSPSFATNIEQASFSQVVDLLRSAITRYVSTLECYVCNFSDDIAETLNSRIRQLRHDCDFTLRNMLGLSICEGVTPCGNITPPPPVLM